MRVEVLGAYGGLSDVCRTTSLLFGESLAVDAGSLVSALAPERVLSVRTVVLTHAHADHIAQLPFFLESVFAALGRTTEIWAAAETIDAVHRHLFNDSVWPDFTRIPSPESPALRFRELRDERPHSIEGLTITPVPVNHPVPTRGLLVEQGESALLWSSDTGVTDRLWEIANATPHLGAVWVDTSFDSARQELADRSGHLTSGNLAAELAKLERPVDVRAHHLKPPFIESIRHEIQALEGASIGFVEQGGIYEI